FFVWLKKLGVSTRGILVYGAMAFRGDDDGVFRGSQIALARHTGISREHICRELIPLLIEALLIYPEQPGGRTWFRFLHHPAMEDAEESPGQLDLGFHRAESVVPTCDAVSQRVCGGITRNCDAVSHHKELKNFQEDNNNDNTAEAVIENLQ